MKNKKKNSAIGVRPNPEARKIIEDMSKTQRRSMANICAYIVEQYLSSTKGKLLDHVNITSTNAD